MAFNRDGLYLVTPGLPTGQRSWRYTTLDGLTTVDTAAYFNSAYRELAIGDDITVVVVTGAVKTPTGYTAAGRGVVNANASGVVDTTDFTAFGTADTD